MSEEVITTPLETASDIESKQEIQYVTSDSGRPVVVYTAETEEDGEIVRGLLESEGIPVILTRSGSPILGQIFGAGEGQTGEILVAPADVERANSILELSTAEQLPED